jgi:O-antigen/teichoic acid export membrane protein
MKTSESRSRRVIHNTFLLFGSEKTAQLFSLAAFIFLQRRWDVATYGQYALIKNWVAIFATFSDLGLNALTIREVARRRSLAGYYLRNVMAIRSFFSIILVAVLAAVGVLLHYEPLIQVGLVIMGLRIILDCAAGGYVYLLQAHERMGTHGLIVVVGSLIRLAGIVAVVYLGAGIWGVSSIWVFASGVCLLILIFIGLSRKWKPDFSKWKWSEMKQVLGQALPLATFWSLQMLYYRVDTVILKSLQGNEAVGLYDAAYTYLNSTLSLSMLFGLSSFPIFSAAQDNLKDFGRLTLRAIKLLLFLGIPITVGGYLLATPLIVLFSSNKYTASGPLFSILSLSVVPFFISNIYIIVLTVKKPKFLNILYFSLFILNVVLNFVFIPIWGANGAAWATVLCEVVGLVWGMTLIWKYLGKSPETIISKPIFTSLAAAGLMGVGIYFDPRLYWLVLGPAVYGLGLYFFRALEPEDWRSLKVILRFKNK